jgi:hypothetical protein
MLPLFLETWCVYNCVGNWHLDVKQNTVKEQTVTVDFEDEEDVVRFLFTSEYNFMGTPDYLTI